MKLISDNKGENLPVPPRAFGLRVMRPPTISLLAGERTKSLALLSLIVLMAAALRIYDLGAESYWRDEVSMVRVAGGSLESIYTDFRENGRPPVYVVLAHLWMQIFGTSEAATRSLSLLFGVASVVLMYFVARRLFGNNVALLSALLLTISEEQIYHSQNFRYYSLFVLATLASYFFYIRALKTGSTRHFALYLIASVLLFFTHTYAVFVLIAQGLHFIVRLKDHRAVVSRWLLTQVLIAAPIFVTLLPGVLTVAEQAGTTPGTSEVILGPTYLTRPEWREPIETAMGFIFSYKPGPRTFIGAAALLLAGTLFLAIRLGIGRWLGSLGGLGKQARNGLRTHGDQLTLVVLWLVCPIGIPFVLSYLVQPIYETRYTISASPAAYVLLALAIDGIRRVVPQIVSLGVIAILIVIGLWSYYVDPTKEPWRETAAFVQQGARQGDAIIISPRLGLVAEGPAVTASFSWYYRGDLPTCGFEDTLRPIEDEPDRVAECTAANRFWLIMDENPGRVEGFKAAMERQGRAVLLSEQQELRGVTVSLFTRIGP